MLTRLNSFSKVSGLGQSKNVPSIGQKRNAGAKAIKTRLNAVTNIRKITTSMKMIAVAKMKKSEDQLMLSRAFSQPMREFWTEPKVEITPETKYLYVALTTDKGLCGSVNSSIVRELRNTFNQRISEGRTNFSIIVYGEKGRAGLERQFKKYISASLAEVMKPKRFNFKQASELASTLINANYDCGEIVYNRFKNMISFNTTASPILSREKALADLSSLQAYTTIEGGNDMWDSLYEFRTAVRLHNYFCETDTTEFSSRMAAMGNSSKSAGEMIDTLRLLYNRTRQAKITIELIEIISGSVVAEEAA